MVGSITEHVDLVVSDPVQAGHDGRHGRRRHGDVRPRAPARPALLTAPMRIATWNVNSLKARQEAVEKWLERAEPDVLLMQETKLTDAGRAGDGVRDGRLRARPPRRGTLERRRDRGPARRSAIADVVTNFGDGPVRDSGAGRRRRVGQRGGLRPVRRGADAAASPCDGIRFVSLYAPERPRRRLAVLRGQARLVRAARRAGSARRASPDDDLVLGGDFNVAPTDADVWDAERRPRRHPRLGARASRLPSAARAGA